MESWEAYGQKGLGGSSEDGAPPSAKQKSISENKRKKWASMRQRIEQVLQRVPCHV